MELKPLGPVHKYVALGEAVTDKLMVPPAQIGEFTEAEGGVQPEVTIGVFVDPVIGHPKASKDPRITCIIEGVPRNISGTNYI
ncbi:MAG: hypothetical protein MZU84_00345 [Sphingobacterium sp.]|nr:hypothetical protein [Sphingobacterium sp.]